MKVDPLIRDLLLLVFLRNVLRGREGDRVRNGRKVGGRLLRVRGRPVRPDDQLVPVRISDLLHNQVSFVKSHNASKVKVFV